MKRYSLFLALFMTACFMTGHSHAGPDYYLGDASVYSGSELNPESRPNVVFLIDNSGPMKDMGSVEPYDASKNYEGEYPREQVYLRNVSNENITNYQSQKFTVDEIQCSSIADVQGSYPADLFPGVGTEDPSDKDTYQEAFPDGDGYDDSNDLMHPRYALEQNGFWYGALDSKGKCPSNENQWENYLTGNFRNYIDSVQDPTVWTGTTEYAKDDIVMKDAAGTGLKMRCIAAGTSGAATSGFDSATGTDGVWPTTPGEIVTDGTVTWEAMGTVLDMVQYQMENVVFDKVRDQVKIGVMTYGANNHGARVLVPVVEAGTDDVDGAANYQLLLDSLETLQTEMVNGNTQPATEAVFDAWLYFRGQSGNDARIASDKVPYPSPIEYECQTNHLVILTTGSNGDNEKTKTKVGDLDGDGEEGLVDDGAIKLYKYLIESPDLPLDKDPPLTEDLPVSAKVHTNVIQLMTPYVQRLEFATDNEHGHGIYRRINNPAELTEALMDILGGILEADSSFVAPVVPASPENRSYSGDRIYLGFFKPMNEEPWYGNLKKFGLDYDYNIMGFDAAGNEIYATDEFGDFKKDVDGIPQVASYWGESDDGNGNITYSLDGGKVELGGVTEKLRKRLTDKIPRNIYTYMGTSTTLADDSNQFKVADDDVTPNIPAATLGVADDTEAVKLINFIHGYDAFGDLSANTTAVRTCPMGDIMHSKPVVLNYAQYEFNATNEKNILLNRAYIFVGSNDGMMHVFRDADGEEVWSFIPPDLLPNLQYIRDLDRHYYFVDNSAMIYVYDADGDGTITELDSTIPHPDYDATDTSDDGDRAILVFGMRRGGGTDTITDGDPPPSRGSYYAIDITDPENPIYMMQINSEDAGFGELGQTWSLPRLNKMKIGGVTKIVAVFGAGYDVNEDLRYGATQSFPLTDSATVTSDASFGEGVVTSAEGNDPYLPRGRGLYIVEIATLNSGVPSFTNIGTRLWSYTHTDNGAMDYSFPADPLLLDRDSDGYIDHIYSVDTGGQLWRFNVADTVSTNNWEATRIFTANVSGTDIGRKLFYKPTATYSGYDTFVYFGSGDREHPLNTAVMDRFYVVRDREEDSDPPTYPLTESNLVDVTEDTLQDSEVDTSALLAELSPPNYSSDDGETIHYGWYMKFDEHLGEKCVAIPKVYNSILYFTTYQPATYEVGDDPCEGKLGPSRFYAVKASTGEAVYNFWEDNDTTDENGTTVVLERRDRYLEIGQGIASEPLVMVDSSGAISVMAGRGGGFYKSDTLEKVDPVFPVYWMKW